MKMVAGARLSLRTGLVLALTLACLLAMYTVQRAGGSELPRCERFAAASQAREQAPSGDGARVVVIGDSYSVGLGLRSPEASWPSRLAGRVQVFGFSGSGFSAHASPCGAVSYADRTRHAVGGGADLVVVEGGLNDVDQPADAVRSGVRRLLAGLRGLPAVVIGPVDAPARAHGVARVDVILAQECARAGVEYHSMLELDPPFLADGLHLSPAGHRIFGDAVARGLSAMG